jgi:hypothetical protein
MTIKITSPASETILLNELPLFLREELGKFTKRNNLVGENCCPWCLKAHLIKKAKEKDMDAWAFEKIDEVFPDRTGHNGYYEDKGRIMEIK